MMKKIAIIACEPSGDLLGYKLINAICSSSSVKYEFCGVGGELMVSSGLKSIVPSADLAIMGYAELLWKIPKLLQHLNRVAKFIIQYKPDMLITIDSPGFNFRLVQYIRKNSLIDYPIIHYVAPTIWAYKPQRINIISKLYDHIILVLPFEKQYFDAVGMRATYVGYPAIEDITATYSPDCTNTVAIIPGSRHIELKQHMPILCQAMKQLLALYGGMRFFIPTMKHLQPDIEKFLKKFNLVSYTTINVDPTVKRDTLVKSRLAIVKSGTVAIELAKMRIPMIVIYKVAAITAWYLKRHIKVKYFNLCNTVIGQEVVPELIQDQFTVHDIIQHAVALLENINLVVEQQNSLDVAISILDNRTSVTNTPNASYKAAKTVLDIMGSFKP